MKRKLFAWMGVAFLLLACALPTYAQEEEGQRETVTIATVEDFLAFAARCALDTWSQDKDVQLVADLDLSEEAFSGIATFGGSFDGGGHTIRGLLMEENTEPAGLFSRIQVGGVVQNLNVEGHVAPGGEGINVGGLAGINAGTVEGCTFTGTVEGKTNTGGITGANTGTISRCTAQGTVQGRRCTGGIAGTNQGTVQNCEGRMAVNATYVDTTPSLSQVDLDFNWDRASASQGTGTPVDTGGICGYSQGTVVNCTQYGVVGYPSIGYNVGGILGRNRGYVASCRNEGHIQGRKDVGGIVGQMEPEVLQLLSPDYLTTLSTQFQQLGNQVDSLGNSTASLGNQLQGTLGTLTSYKTDAGNALEDLLSGLWNDGSFGTPEEDALQDLSDAIWGMAQVGSEMNSILSAGAGDMTQKIRTISSQIAAISDTFAQATGESQEDVIADVSDQQLAEIREGKVEGCTNLGTVGADVNCGGIAGTMGLEYTEDPELDFLEGESLSAKRYELKLVISGCRNMGTICAKRSDCGGICGRMTLGTIWASEGYGHISSTGGNYVGGIAGLAGGTIRNCFAKCTLSGQNYIGGIVGSGISQEALGGSSTVSGCCAMVEIGEHTQFIGAISGGEQGSFVQNIFCSDTLAGINRVSYAGVAEPVSYAQLLATPGLPQRMKRLSLTFVAEEEVLKTQSISYGDSFGTEVYPQIPEKVGYYARWNQDTLTDLHFDTVVTAQYFPLISALASQETRENGSPVAFAQGQFQEGDKLTLEPGKTVFFAQECQQVLEQWCLDIPADGLETHMIRVLPPEEGEIYVLRNGTWNLAETEQMGSYLAFSAPGAEVEFAIVRTQTNYPALAAIVTGTLILAALVVLALRRGTKSPGRRPLLPVLAVALLICAVLGVVYTLPQTQKATNALGAYEVLKPWVEQPQWSAQLQVQARLGEKESGFTARVTRSQVEEIPVTTISERDRELYYAQGVVFLPDGAAYRLGDEAPDYSGILDQLAQMYALVDVEAVDGVYTLCAQEPQSTKLLEQLLPQAKSLLGGSNSLTVDLVTVDDALTEINFTGAGNLSDSVKTPFSLSARICSITGEATDVPQPVRQALLTGEYDAQQVHSDDLVRLATAWKNLEDTPALGATVKLAADCGLITLAEEFRLYRWNGENRPVYAMEMKDLLLYMTDAAICDAQGRAADLPTRETVDIQAIGDVVYENFSKATFRCEGTEEGYCYTVTLTSEGMKTLMTAVLPQVAELDCAYETGTATLIVTDDGLTGLEISCGGSVKVAMVPMRVSLTLEVKLLREAIPDLPGAVKTTLDK